MDAYNINGYGYDLSDITDLSIEQQKIFDIITTKTSEKGNDLEDIYEENNLNSNCLMAFPCNTYDFQEFIYLPDIPAVVTHKMNTKVYTPEEGQKQLFDFTTKLFHAADKEFELDQNKVDDLLKAIKPQIKKFAQYHAFQNYC